MAKKGITIEEFNNIKMLITQGLSFNQIARVTGRGDSTAREINKFDSYEGYKDYVRKRFNESINKVRKENAEKPVIGNKLTEEKFNLIKQLLPTFNHNETANILKVSKTVVSGVRNSETYADYLKWSSDRYQKYKTPTPIPITTPSSTSMNLPPTTIGDFFPTYTETSHKELITAIHNLTETLVSIETYFKQMTPLEKEGLMDRLFRGGR